jgi:type IV secretory pathway ATPase VirB11/archaellum biosynthesis ATPase
VEPSTAALAALVRDGVIDAELAALVWLAFDAGVPVVVAGEPAAARAVVRDAIAALADGHRPLVRLAGDAETFAWMPEAGELGWQASGRVAAAVGSGAVMVADLTPGFEVPTWGEHARLAIRALTAGYGLAATADGDRLEDVLGRLSAAPVGAIDDELTRLGIVLILGADAGGATRVRAAHYLRPVARDVHGHIQRLAPAALAMWNGKTGRFDHFAWGVLDELAGRAGVRPLAFEREQAVRAGRLAGAARAL